MNKIIPLLFIIFTLISCETKEAAQSSKENSDSFTEQIDNGPTKCNLTDLGIDQALGSPTTIGEAIELVNALPRPLNIPCFLSSLNRPLKVNLTSSGRSAQPARGDESPRVFIMNMPLVMSVTVEGGGSAFIEFAEFTTEQRSIKAELKFPIKESFVDISTPFEKVAGNNSSTCAGCHVQETKVIDSIYPGDVYESLAMKPASNQKVEISEFKLEGYRCDLLVELDNRCIMIRAILDNGEVVHEDFPNSTLTFFDSFGL